MQNVKYEIISCSYNEQNLYSQNWCQFSPTYIDCTRLIVFHFQWKWWRTVPRKCLCLGTLLNVLFCKQFQVFFFVSLFYHFFVLLNSFVVYLHFQLFQWHWAWCQKSVYCVWLKDIAHLPCCCCSCFMLKLCWVFAPLMSSMKIITEALNF